MACKLINVRPTTDCTENYSGTGNKAYIARMSTEMREALEYSETAPEIICKDADELAKIEFHEIVLKSKVNKVDYQSNPNGGGFTATANMVVDKQVDSWAMNARVLNNTSDWCVLLSTGKSGEFYFLGSPAFDNEFSDAGTTGDAPDSDKGSTVTITAGPLQYEYLKIKGFMNADSAGEKYTFSASGE